MKKPKRSKQLYFTYRDLAVTPDLYVLEYDVMHDVTADSKTTAVIPYKGKYAYQRAVIYAYDNSVTGFIIYPLTRSRIFIVNGEIRRKGRKPPVKTDNVDLPFSSQTISATGLMKKQN